MSKKYIDEISGFPILADKVKTGFTGVSHDNTLSGDGTDELPLGVITSGPAFTGVEHDETLSGNGTNESPLGVTIDIPAFTGVEHDTNLSGNGTQELPLGVADPIFLKNSTYSATYANNYTNLANTENIYFNTTPSGVKVYRKENNNLISSATLNDKKLEFKGDQDGYNYSYYASYNNFGITETAVNGTQSAGFIINNSPGSSKRLVYSAKNTAGQETTSYTECYNDRIEINNYINGSASEGIYGVGYSYQKSICEGYSSPYYIMNSNSGVAIPSRDYTVVEVNTKRGFLEVQGGPSSNTMGIVGTQINPGNVLCWGTTWSRDNFSQLNPDGLNFWKLGEVTGQPVAYVNYNNMQFYDRTSDETVYFSFNDLKKLRQILDNTTV